MKLDAHTKTAACYRLLVLNLVERSEQPPDFHSNNFVFIYLVVFDSNRPTLDARSNSVAEIFRNPKNSSRNWLIFPWRVGLQTKVI